VLTTEAMQFSCVYFCFELLSVCYIAVYLYQYFDSYEFSSYLTISLKICDDDVVMAIERILLEAGCASVIPLRKLNCLLKY
jgi:hypothetical protein